MSLFSPVSSIVGIASNLVNDGAVTFDLPRAIFTDSRGNVADVVTTVSFLTGATRLHLGSSIGSTLGGDIMTGSLITIEGLDYVVTDTAKSKSDLVVDIAAPGLVTDVSSGASVTGGPTSVQLSRSTTTSTKSASGRSFESQVTFAFQYPRADYAVLPRVGWKCSRTSTSGTPYRGAVIESDSGEIMVTVWCGGG